MLPEDLKTLIESCIPNSSATVVADGNKYEAIVVSDDFEALSMLKAHQMVNKCIAEHIQSGAIHAFSVKTYTNTEWQTLQS